MIAASRAVLDAVETLVRDPATAAQATATVGHVAKAVVDAVAGAARPQPVDDPPTEEEEGFERIEVT